MCCNETGQSYKRTLCKGNRNKLFTSFHYVLIVSISFFSKEHNLDYEKLLDSSEYKEIYRADMVKWGEQMREKDLSFFVRYPLNISSKF